MGNYWIIQSEVEKFVCKLEDLFEPYLDSVYATEKDLLGFMNTVNDSFLKKNPKFAKYMAFIIVKIHAEPIMTATQEIIWKFVDFEVIKNI
jgi:hypothetical protein